MKKIHQLLIVLIVSIIIGSQFVTGCKKKNDDAFERNDTLMDITHQILDQWYFWIESVPEVNPGLYDTPEELLEAIRYYPKDKWSYITDKTIFENYYKEGKYVGLGLKFAFDAQNNLRVAYIFEDSPLAPLGVQRGWTVKKVNGKPIDVISDLNEEFGGGEAGIDVQLQFEDTKGNTKDMVVTTREVTINSLLYSRIYELEEGKTGYIFLQTFIEKTKSELDDVFADFKQKGVSDLVIDLRYNTGGDVSACEYFADLIAGKRFKDNIFFKTIHNAKQTDKNRADSLEERSNSIEIDKAVFITSSLTASASELLINGLEPYLDVRTIGDYTYGKPVGMYSWIVGEKVIVPVTFEALNSRDNGGYYNGIGPDYFCRDDLSYLMGDSLETCLNSALYYIQFEAFPVTAKMKASQVTRFPAMHGFQYEIGAY